MYVCVYVHVCTCVFVFARVYGCGCVLCVCTCVYIYICVCMCVLCVCVIVVLLLRDSKGDYRRKNNDLYQFEQTTDLAQVDASRYPTLARLARVIRSRAMTSWVASVTGVTDLQPETADLFGANYGDGAHLLCHDDRMPNRRVAYIVYLVPEDWSAEDGGALDLFGSCSAADGSPQPCDRVAASTLPAWNTLMLFPVSQRSFHQVAEVLSEDRLRTRLSIGGWFYGPDLGVTRTRKPPPQLTWQALTKPLDSPRYPGLASEAPTLASGSGGHAGTGKQRAIATQADSSRAATTNTSAGASDECAQESEAERSRVASLPHIPELWMDDEAVLPWWLMEAACWVNHTYLNPLVQEQIRDSFVEESSVLLQDFLLPGRLRRASADLQRVRWCARGPAHKQFYYEVVHGSDGSSSSSSSSSSSDLLPVPSSSSVLPSALATELPLSADQLTELEQELGPPGAELQRLQDFLRSEVFAALLATLSNVEVRAAVSTLRRFAHGSYTLMHDEQAAEEEATDLLDGCLCLMPAWPSVWASQPERRRALEQTGDECAGGKEHDNAGEEKLAAAVQERPQETTKEHTRRHERPETTDQAVVQMHKESTVTGEQQGDWKLSWGGWLAYVADDEELITVLPEHNCLSLVYREANSGVQQFVKYLNHHAPCQRYDVQICFQANA
jgi:Rps23 Pro-64 3,4-dihydroxylase Tpa1-like proline 4-hydroxylase